MSNGIWVAASGAVARQTQLDATANNLANATTNGFKADQPVFAEHLVRAAYAGRNVDQMRLVSVGEIRPDLRQGPITVTNRSLDVALTDEAFFSVRTAGGERYTRAGSFEVTAAGGLTTAGGLPVLDPELKPIVVGVNAAQLRIDGEGSVWADGAAVAQLRVVKFPNAAVLEKEGNLLYRATEGSGRPEQVEARLEAGAVERSNMPVVKGMTDIVSASRAFDALQKAIEAFKDADRRAATDLMHA